MGKFFCIYKGREYDDAHRTTEHIVPFAVGGSDDLVTRDVCKIANDIAGSKWDAPLINHQMIELARWSRKIASKDGHVPDLHFEGPMTGRDDDAPSRGYMTLGADGTNEVHSYPALDWDWENNSVNIRCDAEDYDAVMQTVRERLAKKGLTMPDDATLNATRRSVIYQPTIHAPRKWDLHGMHPAFVKMALGIAHKVFGHRWSKGATADLFRRYLWSSPRERAALEMKGSIWPGTFLGDRANRPRLKDLIAVTDDHHEFLIFSPGPRKLAFAGVLFGEYDAILDLGDDTCGFAPQVGEVFVIDTRTRDVRRRSFSDHIAALHTPWITGWIPPRVA